MDRQIGPAAMRCCGDGVHQMIFLGSIASPAVANKAEPGYMSVLLHLSEDVAKGKYKLKNQNSTILFDKQAHRYQEGE